MDELKTKAARAGISNDDLVDLTVGGCLSVLRNSEQLQGDGSVLKKILECLGDEAVINMKQYEKIKSQNSRSSLPKILPSIGAFFKPNIAARNDKDAEHTREMGNGRPLEQEFRRIR